MRAFAAKKGFETKLVHTGQHYDDALSKVFFDELGIPRPDIDLGVGSGTHTQQTASVMTLFENVLEDEQPHVVLVVGDVNSTVACSLVSSKFRLKESFECTRGTRDRPIVIHVEAGLRSFDDEMPEEINRKVTDCLSDVLFVSDPAGNVNLAKEGVKAERISFVGNVMIDTLLAAKEKAMSSEILTTLGLSEGGYGLVTLHRPSNVDEPEQLAHIIGVLDDIAEQDVPLVFPVHPRTRARIEDAGIKMDESRWFMTGPVGYLDFMRLMAGAKVVLSDSGGIQEETTVLGVRCVTLRENTERPVTVDEGTNVLAGIRRETIMPAWKASIAAEPSGRIPRFWDGKSAERIADYMGEMFSV
jgi:UDP-N-acetylglucosamine 2-epimerase (non-hydrolysing)